MGTGFGKRVPEMSLINSLRRGRESKGGRGWGGGIPRKRERERQGQRRGGGMTERWSGCIKEDQEEKEEIMRRGGGAGEQRGEGLWGKDTAAMEAEVE